MEIKNVVSYFDGMSCGQIALDRVGIKPEKYFAFEIDEPAIKVAQSNYPNTIQMGSVVGADLSALPKIDLFIGGSPCQSFSNAGDGSGFDGKSGLFWEFVKALKEIKPKYFLLENVKMKKEWQQVITEALGCEPIEINSKFFSSQNRPRLYWTNIPNIKEVPVGNSTLGDVLEKDVDPKFTLSDKAVLYMDRLRNGKPRWEYHKNNIQGKAACLTANMHKGVPYGVIKELNRRLTPLECERLQTIPDNYTSCVSNTQRYKMIGNGWTVDVIAHIFKGLL